MMDVKRVEELRELAKAQDSLVMIRGRDIAEMLDIIKRLTETLDTLMHKRGSRIRTHWEGCWRYHGECAIAMVERLQDENATLSAADAEQDKIVLPPKDTLYERSIELSNEAKRKVAEAGGDDDA